MEVKEVQKQLDKGNSLVKKWRKWELVGGISGYVASAWLLLMWGMELGSRQSSPEIVLPLGITAVAWITYGIGRHEKNSQLKLNMALQRNLEEVIKKEKKQVFPSEDS